MASACDLQWVPDSLYNTAISAIVTQYSRSRKELKILPENVQFDIYYKLYNKGRLCDLALEFSELEVFARVLKVTDKSNLIASFVRYCEELHTQCFGDSLGKTWKRHLLHHCFQAVMDNGQLVSSNLADAYSQHCCVNHAAKPFVKERVIQLGFSLGGFLSDAGWYYDSEKVLSACLQMCKQVNDPTHWGRALECCVRLLSARNANCKYAEAESTWKEAQTFLGRLENVNFPGLNRATLYSEYCALLFAKSQYDQAYKYCCLALGEVTTALPPKAVVDVFRHCSKACVVKREFVRAELLIKFAVQYAREHFGMKHHKYSDALLDYGFFLLNVDCIFQAVQVYQAALDIRSSVFGGNNLHVALAHEDLAYSSYVHEYSSGRFQDAKEHAERAIEIINHILPDDHLLLASSKRVKALILEELAIDSHNNEKEEQLLQEAQDLHIASLALAKKAFGESNVQTAKHYGNLGRLYQSMHKYNDAEEMHLKAIEIKERLLGPEDYEVALSVGHLASLYNYDMQKYTDAEALYLRSIAIGKKLFGPGYSGLEYDYRGLLRLYHATEDNQKAVEYGLILHEWNQIRDQSNAEEKKPLEFEQFTCIAEVLGKFSELR